MTKDHKLNIQAILHITRMNEVFPSQNPSDPRLYYYYLIDALGRKWQTIGHSVTDAIYTFQAGASQWTQILEPAPYNPDLTSTDLIRMLDIGEAEMEMRQSIEIIMNSSERCNEFVSRLVNVNPQDIVSLVCQMQDERLLHQQIPDDLFMKMYAANPVEALTRYFLQTIDIHMFWAWNSAGGTPYKAIQYKREDPLLSFVWATDRAEEEQERPCCS